MKNRRFLKMLLGVGLLLLMPFVAMQLTDEVVWTLSDFILAGALLLIAVAIAELVLRKVPNRNQRIIFCGILLILLLLTWMELAVGIFNSPFAGS